MGVGNGRQQPTNNHQQSDSSHHLHGESASVHQRRTGASEHSRTGEDAAGRSEPAEQLPGDGHRRDERGSAVEQAPPLERQHRLVRVVLERHVRSGNWTDLSPSPSPELRTDLFDDPGLVFSTGEASPKDRRDGVFHPDGPVPEFLVLRVAGGEESAGRGSDHAADSSSNQTIW